MKCMLFIELDEIDAVCACYDINSIIGRFGSPDHMSTAVFINVSVSVPFKMVESYLVLIDPSLPRAVTASND